MNYIYIKFNNSSVDGFGRCLVLCETLDLPHLMAIKQNQNKWWSWEFWRNAKKTCLVVESLYSNLIVFGTIEGSFVIKNMLKIIEMCIFDIENEDDIDNLSTSHKLQN